MTHGSGKIPLALGGIDLDRPIKTGEVYAPPVRSAEGDYLVFHAGERKKHRTTRGLLSTFIELEGASDADVVRFCRRWGVLGLCPHGLPSGGHRCGEHLADSQDPAIHKESIAGVMRFAGAFAALLRIAAEISQQRPGSVEDWEMANKVISGPDFPPWDVALIVFHVDVARLHLQILMRVLIHISNVQPRFFWNRSSSSWQIDMDAEGLVSNLPALLAIELMVTIADKDGFAVCSSCHRSYIPLRKPDPTRRNYCDKCGLKAAWRDAARERRRKLRENNVETRKR